MTIAIVTPDASARSVKVTSSTTRSNSSRISVGREVPYEIPRGQLYYWTGQWRRDERESEATRNEGRFRVFDHPTDPTDAARWLLGDDE